MSKELRIALLMCLTALLLTGLAFSQDEGEKDTCRVEEIATVLPNSHFELEISAFNDEALGAYAIPLSYGAPPMDIVCDSFSFAGSRTVNTYLYGLEVDTSNYSLILYAVWFTGDLSPGDGKIATLYFSTGPGWDSAQGVAIDTVFWPPTISLEFTNASTGFGFDPAFKRGSAGPYFLVLSPDGGEIWFGGETREILWASSLSEVENVKIEYSTNNGANWTSIVDSTPNDGSYLWNVPSVYSTECLIKISEVTDGKPWDISYSTFTILLFSMSFYPQQNVIDVGGGSADYIVKINSVGYNSPVTLSLSSLPPEANYNFSLNPIIPPDSSILTVVTNSNTPVGTYFMTLTAQGDGETLDSQPILVVNQAPEPFNLSFPGNGDTATTTIPPYLLVGWEKATDPDLYDTVRYSVYYSTDSNFVLQDSFKTTSTSEYLTLQTDSIFYFWKVKAVDKWGKYTWCNQSFWSFFYLPIYPPLPNRGDANADGKVNVTDVIYLINYLFRGGPPPVEIEQGDANCDGKISITDVIYLINYMFKGGPVPHC